MKSLTVTIALTAIAAAPSSAQLDPSSTPASLGPHGGPIDWVALNPVDPLELLVLAEYGDDQRLLRSTDGAATFVSEPSPWTGGQEITLALDPESPHAVYLASGERVYRSADFGRTWSGATVSPGVELRGIEVALSGGSVFAYSWHEAWRSTDGGATWVSVLQTPVDAILDVATAPTDPLRVYVGATNGHVYRSLDGGSSFSLPGTQGGLLQHDVEAVIVDPTSAEILLAGGFPGLFRSTDGGLTFTELVTGLNPLYGWVGFWYDAGDQRLWGSIWGGTLVHSLDFGATTWTQIFDSAEGETLSPRELVFAPDGTRYLADFRGLLQSELIAPETWFRIGIANKRITEVALLSPGGDRLCVESEWGVVSALYRGAPGATVVKVTDVPGIVDCYISQTPTVGALLVDPEDPDHWLASTYGWAWGVGYVVLILSHRDGGTTIETVSCDVDLFAGEVVDLLSDPHTPSHFLAVADDDTKASADSGDTWSLLTGLGGIAPAAMAFDPFTPGRILALEDPDAAAGIQTRFSQSLDGGLTWSSPADAWPGDGDAVLLEKDPFMQTVIYGGDTGTGLWRSIDNGVTWSPTGVTLHADSELISHPDFPGLLWVSDDSGAALVSADAGGSFRTAVAMPGIFTRALGLAIDPTDGTLLFGTEEASLFELSGASPFVKLGPGTAGTGGHVPRHYPNGEFPSIGNSSYALVGDHVVGGGFVVPVVGFGELPFSFAGGTFWVDLVQSPHLILPLLVASGAPGVAGAGTFLSPLPLPPNPSLVGATLVSQYAVLADSGAADPSGYVLSDGMRATLIP